MYDTLYLTDKADADSGDPLSERYEATRIYSNSLSECVCVKGENLQLTIMCRYDSLRMRDLHELTS